MLWKKILFLTLIKIIIISRPSTFIRVFLRRRPICSTNDGIACVRACVCVCACLCVCSFARVRVCVCISASSRKKLFPSIGYQPHSKIEFPCPTFDHIVERIVSLIAFRQIVSKILHVASIFSYTIMTYLKKLDGIKSLNTKQCPSGLSPRIIPKISPFLPKIFLPLRLFCCSCQVWTVSPSPESL